MNKANKHNFILFIIKFLVLFAFFYFGTLGIIGLSAPGGYHIEFIEKYFDYVSWLKLSYLKGGSVIAYLFNYTTVVEPGFIIRVINKRGVIIAYDCVGYGVMSFWAAFVISNQIKFISKIKWLVGGLLMLWSINTIRIGLFLVAINKNWPMPLGLNHHTWFSIFAYCAIFLMIYFFEKKLGDIK